MLIELSSDSSPTNRTSANVAEKLEIQENDRTKLNQQKWGRRHDSWSVQPCTGGCETLEKMRMAVVMQ
jgi:hypothetical protein